MDRIATLKRSFSRKARDEQDEIEKGFKSMLKKAKEVRTDRSLQAVKSTESMDIDYVNPLVGDVQHKLRLHVADRNGVPDVHDRDTKVSSQGQCIAEVSQMKMTTERDWRENQTSYQARAAQHEDWDAKMSAERFSRLRHKILEERFSQKVYRVESSKKLEESERMGGSGPVVCMNSLDEAAVGTKFYQQQSSAAAQEPEGVCMKETWPLARVRSSGQPQKFEVAEPKPFSQRRYAHVQKVEKDPAFIFTAGVERPQWRNTGTVVSQVRQGQRTIEHKVPIPSERSVGHRNQRVSHGASSRLRMSESSAESLRSMPPDEFQQPARKSSQSLEHLLKDDSPGRPSVSSEKDNNRCMKVLRNARAIQKDLERGRKLVRQSSATERARLTAELQMLARECSISNCGSSERAPWDTVKTFLSSLFCFRCNIPRNEPESDSDQKSTSVFSEGVMYRDGEKPSQQNSFPSPYCLRTPFFYPSFPVFVERQKPADRHDWSVSRDLEVEKAIGRAVDKRHDD